MRFIYLILISILFSSCICSKYSFDAVKVKSITILNLKNKKTIKIKDKIIINKLINLFNNNCYQFNLKRKINPNFRLTLKNKSINDSIVINTNSIYFNVTLKNEILGQYKFNENVKNHLNNIMTGNE